MIINWHRIQKYEQINSQVMGVQYFEERISNICDDFNPGNLMANFENEEETCETLGDFGCQTSLEKIDKKIQTDNKAEIDEVEFCCSCCLIGKNYETKKSHYQAIQEENEDEDFMIEKTEDLSGVIKELLRNDSKSQFCQVNTTREDFHTCLFENTMSQNETVQKHQNIPKENDSDQLSPQKNDPSKKNKDEETYFYDDYDTFKSQLYNQIPSFKYDLKSSSGSKMVPSNTQDNVKVDEIYEEPAISKSSINRKVLKVNHSLMDIFSKFNQKVLKSNQKIRKSKSVIALKTFTSKFGLLKDFNRVNNETPDTSKIKYKKLLTL